MKKNYFFTSAVILFVVFVTACTSSRTDRDTIANLKSSFNSENYTSDRYNAFSEKAVKEGYLQVAKLFKALSVAESIHAKKFKAVLESAGINMEKSDPDYKVESTEINLKNAIQEEIMDIDFIYPGYVKESANSPLTKANSAFSSVWEAEKTHKKLLALIYDILMTNEKNKDGKVISSVPSRKNLDKIESLFSETDYYISPADGKVYDSMEYTENCLLCNSPNANYIMISESDLKR
jgi:rubrerythrin